MPIKETSGHFEFTSEDQNGFYKLRITKKYPIQVQIGTEGSNEDDDIFDFAGHVFFNSSRLELEELKEMIDQALTHFE